MAAAQGLSDVTPSAQSQVYIFDTTLRDGEQAPGCSMTVTEKLRMAHKLEELGVDILEAGFPIASDGRLRGGATRSGREVQVRVAALARVHARWTSSGRPRRWSGPGSPPRIHIFLATSDIHLKYKLKKTAAAGAGRGRRPAVELARKYVDDVEFSAEDGGRTDPIIWCRSRRRSSRPARRRSTSPTPSGTRFPTSTAR